MSPHGLHVIVAEAQLLARERWVVVWQYWKPSLNDIIPCASEHNQKKKCQTDENSQWWDLNTDRKELNLAFVDG